MFLTICNTAVSSDSRLAGCSEDASLDANSSPRPKRRRMLEYPSTISTYKNDFGQVEYQVDVSVHSPAWSRPGFFFRCTVVLIEPVMAVPPSSHLKSPLSAQQPQCTVSPPAVRLDPTPSGLPVSAGTLRFAQTVDPCAKLVNKWMCGQVRLTM